MPKRTIGSFFAKLPDPISKKPRLDSAAGAASLVPPTKHASYPHPIASLPTSLLDLLDKSPPEPHDIAKPDLSITHYHFFPSSVAKDLFLFLRRSLPFYRVTYTIKRDSLDTTIRTPRYTTVFGVDAHSHFSGSSSDEDRVLLDAGTDKPLSSERYRKCMVAPRPIPACLEVLKNLVERETGETFNFVLVNYYASSSDSISYHSDDETFLGPNPTIASLSLGATRDFLMKHKTDKGQTLKLGLTNGELIVMKGATQRMWLHSIPKRAANPAGTWHSGGRINITFRNGRLIPCTANYYRYNVGNGPVYRWDDARDEMALYTPSSQPEDTNTASIATSIDEVTSTLKSSDTPASTSAKATGDTDTSASTSAVNGTDKVKDKEAEAD
ncbi:hypothetical protein ABW21_db0209094 [Orbilia brochopaga]|nr:hypothetical protein ABW21_db0209094 [Drechslerella brochopaga]